MNIVDPNKAPAARPWHRRPGEGAKAHAAALLYFTMGVGRNHRKVAEEAETSEGQIGDWSRKWKWVERAAEFDSHQADVEQYGRDVARAQAAEVWEKRKLEVLEQDFQLGNQLRDRIREMLMHPIVSKKTTKDGRTTIVKAIRWNAGNIAQLAKLASEIQASTIKAAMPEEAKSDEPTLPEDVEAQINKVYREGDEEAA